MNYLISVIIPARNSAKTIAEAIRSIQDQTYRNLEIIVVDDNSADNTNIFFYSVIYVAAKYAKPALCRL